MYAIKVPFGNPEDEDTDWIYVTEPSDADFHDIQVKQFETIEDAEKTAKMWRIYAVVEYNQES